MARQQKSDQRTEVVEHGDIYFFYRPKVDTDEAEGLEDVQRFHIVLRPHQKQLFRLVTVGRKRLPDIGEHERTWGVVDLIAKSARDIELPLREQAYEARTRGERTRPG